MLSYYLSIKRSCVFVLLFAVLLLPMLHLHPAHGHTHGEVETHLHQHALHADFFPDATHGHHDQGLDAVDLSDHMLSEIGLLSLQGQSFQFPSVFKKNLGVSSQIIFDFSLFAHFRKGMTSHQYALPSQTLRFSPPSLRGPPYFA